MKRFTYAFVAFMTLLFTLTAALQAQTLIPDWGKTSQGGAWPILSASAGSVSIGGPNPIPGWATVRGEFDTLRATTGQAVVVTGKLEFVGTSGGGNTYTPFRYALTYHADDTLSYALTDSARWVRGPGWGYVFCPRTGAGTVANGAWGTGTVGPLNNGNWNSTNSNGGLAFATILQAPRNAEMVTGTYDFAFSVQAVDDTTNELRWYFVEENNRYWFGGTIIDTATTAVFNGVSFGFNTGGWTQINITEASAGLGAPITVPEAPWEAYYIDQWGQTTQGRYWPVQNDSSTLVGDGSIMGAAPINGAGQASIRGGFGQELQIRTNQALIVSGELELVGTVGGEDSYNPLRFALTYNANDTLRYALTDSAYWVRGPGYGWNWCPRTGAGTVANGAWGTGTVGRVNNGNWHSTNSNGGPALGTILQAPRNADMVPGTYEWAISVQQVGDTINEIRWYLIEENNRYWFGGVVTDTAITRKLTGVSFNVNTGDWTAVNVIAAQVDYGAPITVPEAPWEAYYIDQWGQTTQGRYWPVQNDSSTLVGDGSIAGTAPINGSGQASIRGGFGQELLIKSNEALIVSGELELVGTVGGESSYNPLRFAITYNANDTLRYALTDSAYWVRGPGYGYNWCPRTGAGTVANGAWGTGTVGIVNNGNWHSTNSNGGPALATILQAPRNAEMVPGTYEWAISVHQVNDTTNEIRWYLIEEDNRYWFGGIVTGSAVTDRLTGVSFNVNTGDWTAVNVIAAQVDYGAPITIPEAPWQPYYVDQWGQTTQGRYWPILNDSSTLVGDATLAGDGTPLNGTGWATIRGGFGQNLQIKTNEALIVRGELELVGSVGGEDSYTPIRYAITYHANDTLQYALTDSAYWVRGTGSGYQFMPRTGAGIVANGAWGTGTVGVLNDGNWNSTNSNNGPALATILQAPRNAEIIPGTYSWAISVQQVGDTTNEVRWYLLEENNQYFYGGIIDAPISTNMLNGICFGINTGDWTEFNILATEVDYGAPIDIPKIFEVVVDGEKDEFYTTLEGPDEGYLQITSIHGNDNGFPVSNSDLSMKVWTAWDEEWFYLYQEVMDDTITGGTTSNVWETDNLELKFDPQPTDSVTNSIWDTRLTAPDVSPGDSLNNITDSTAKQFARRFIPGGFATELAIKWTAIVSATGGETITPEVGNVFGLAINQHDNDGAGRQASIMWAAVMLDAVWNTPKYLGRVYFLDDHKLEFDPTNNMTGVENELPYDSSAVDVEIAKPEIPTEFSLSQNYPNPFNPSTTIEFALATQSDVSLIVYDALGRVVKELANGSFTAGYYKINFNASNLASGIYFYVLRAGDFVSIKKLMLIK